MPGPEGAAGWRLRQAEAAVPDSSALRQPRWVAFSSRHTLSIPVRLPASDAAQREAAVQLELEAAGIQTGELSSHRFQVLETDPSGKDDSAAVFLIDGSLPPELEISRTLDSSYAPSTAFHPLASHKAALWREDQSWVLAIPHESGRILHAQPLTAAELDGDAATEINCVLAGLELADLLPRLDQLIIETGDPSVMRSGFASALPFPVTVTEPPPPRPPAASFRLAPDEIVAARADRTRQRTLVATLAVVTAVLVTALGTFAAALRVREGRLLAQVETLDTLEPEIQAVRDAQSQFAVLDPTLNRDQFVVEIFYQLVRLLPPEGIRLLRFNIQADSIFIDGAASSEIDAVNFRGELTSSEFFKDYGFDQGFTRQPPTPDGGSTFRAEGRLRRSADEEGELVAGF
jgi:hypothetical protein